MTWAIAALAALPVAEVRLELVRGGVRAGEVRMEQRILEDGRKLSRVEFRSDPPGAEVAQESTYAPDGRPTRMLQATVSGGGRESRSATFDDEGAVFSVGSAAPKVVPVPSSLSTAAPNEFWFVRDAPIQGESVRYMRFDLSSGAWKESVAQYVGPREIVVRGSVRKTRRVVVDGVVSHVDDQGLPWRVELADGSTLERL